MLQKFLLQQTPRTQVFGLTVFAVTVAGLVGWGVWRPLHANLSDSKLELARSSASLVEMQQLVASYEAMADAGLEGTYPGLTAIVNQSLQGKSFQPSRIQQNGEGELVIRVDNVPFQLAVEWINELEKTRGLVVGTVAVSQSQNGLVNLTLALTGL